MTPDLDLLATRILAQPARAGATRVVAVDGPSGAGKTTFAGALGERVAAPVVHMDAIYPGWNGLDEGSRRLVAHILRPLAEGRPPAIRRWDWAEHHEGAWEPVPDAATLVVEGAGAAPREAAPFLSFTIWVDADPDERHRRAIARDGDVFAPHWDRWATQERLAFEREGTRERADLVVRTDAGAVLGAPP